MAHDPKPPAADAAAPVEPLGAERRSLREVRDLLPEVQQAAREAGRDELHAFATLLVQLLELHDAVTADRSNRGTDARQLADFVVTGWAALQSSHNEESDALERIDALTQQAAEQWGDQLALPGDEDEGAALGDWAWRGGESDGAAAVAEAEMRSPSEAEVSELLSQLKTELIAEPAAASPATEAGAEAGAPGVAIDALAGEETLEVNDELREAFLDDAGRCVGAMEEALLTLESAPEDEASLRQICRELHTLKGASGSVGLSGLAEYLHEVEETIRAGTEPGGERPSVEQLLRSVDDVRRQIARLQAPSSHPDPTPATAEQAPALRAGSPPPLAEYADAPGEPESVRVKSSQLNRLMDMLAELVMLRNRRDCELSELKAIHRELMHSVSRLRVFSEGEDGAARRRSGAVAAPAAEPRRHSPRLTEVANDVLEAAGRLRDCYRPVAEGNSAVSQFIRQFRQELVELRRMPVSGLFRRLRRVASDAARAEGKRVQLHLLGEGAGIERSLQERLYDPLLHVVRNAVSHGIESGDERQRLGKSPCGNITLEAQTGPDLLVVEIRDDGRGLDYDALRRRGIEAGLLSPDKAASRDELSQLIFHPGFSTRQTASQTAGRGVGMEVVASTIARMRGWVEVDSVRGKGTTIRLTFPLPSVIQHTMVFRSAGQLFALPMQFVHGAGNAEESVFGFRLAELLARDEPPSLAPPQTLVLASDAPAPEDSGGGCRRFALLVDEILGPEEVVVRPMPPLLKHHPLCSGATLSGNGETVLVLDHHRLVEFGLRRGGAAGASGPERGTRPADAPRRAGEPADAGPAAVLVVDDSLSARKCLVRSLRRYGVETVEAADGAEARELVKTRAFAAVFSDLEMPQLGGFELLAELRSSGTDAASVPVVIVSSRAEDAVRRRASELGADGFLPKPLTDDALDLALQSLASLRPIVDSRPSTSQASPW